MVLKKKLAISDNGFIFDPTTGESYSMNHEAIEILTMLKEGKNDEEIKKRFLDEYDVDELTFERSYLAFIAMLRHYNLLENEE